MTARRVHLPDGASLAYDDAGRGEPVLFIHGFPLDRTMWASQLDALAPHARCIAPDLRGLGESTTATDGHGGFWSIDGYALDMAALMKELGIDRARIVGLSMGGYVALAMWRLVPQRVAGLALVDTRAGADDEEGRRKRDDAIALARSGGAAAVAEKMLPSMVGKTTRDARADVSRTLDEMMRRAPAAGVIGALQAMRDRPDSTPLLSTVTVPAVVIVGAEDTITPVKEARAMADAIPGATLEILEQAGHLSPLERPDAVNDALRRWLSR